MWPASERWPECRSCKRPLVPLLQLRARDVPLLRFWPDSDLFQLLVCPLASHNSPQVPWRSESPNTLWLGDNPVMSRVFWRSEAEITRPVLDHPYSSGAEDGYRVNLCSIFPEPVIEYPDEEELEMLLGRERASRVESRARSVGSVECPDVDKNIIGCKQRICPGSKVGGRPMIVCEAGVDPETGVFVRMACEHFVTLSSIEFDQHCFRRWMPIEEQRRQGLLGNSVCNDRLLGANGYSPLSWGNCCVYLNRTFGERYTFIFITPRSPPGGTGW